MSQSVDGDQVLVPGEPVAGPGTRAATLAATIDPPSGRLDALDAVRAFALLSGVVLHAALAYVMQPGDWGIGVRTPDLGLWAFVHYIHDFRMQLFFLLAGFFGARIVSRRGVRAFVRDRVVRIGLVFIALLYPIKLLISIPWIAGGIKTGWLNLPPATAQLPLTVLAIAGLQDEHWPMISPAHLWFLYYLLLVTALFIALRWVAQRPGLSAIAAGAVAVADGAVRLLGHPLGPIALALPVIPVLATTARGILESPDRGFVPEPAAVVVYLYFFAVGWVLHKQPGTLKAFGRHGLAWLACSLLAGGLGFWLELQSRTASPGAGLPWAPLANALTLGFAVLGSIGLAIDRLNTPIAWVRYLADASYWVYLAHLPIVVALQVWVSDWGIVPLQLLVIIIATFALTLITYDLWVRDTPIGSWLNGRRYRAWIRRRTEPVKA